MSRILFEAHSLTQKTGTGIATYARNLADVTQAAGHQAELVLGTERGPNRKHPVLTDVGVFDANLTLHNRSGRWLREACDWALGAPLGIATFPVGQSAAVLDPSSGQPLRNRMPTYGAVRLADRAYAHFQRHGARARLNVETRPDIFHASRPVALTVPKATNIYTIHDLVPLRLPYATLDNKSYFYRLLRTLLRDADHIVTVSEFTRRDVIAMFGIAEHRITNTWQAVSLPEHLVEAEDNLVAGEVERLFELPYRGYFLFLGAIEPKKNVSRMLDAFVASGTSAPLVLAGGLGWQYDQEVKRLDDEQFTSWRLDGSRITRERRVQRLSYLPRAQLVSLIRGARAVLFPSLYEGFGLPVLEAMLLGTPVITSNTSCLPEVAGDAALLVDPYDVGSIAAAIRAVDADADLRAAMIQRGRERAAFFAPVRYAERLAAVYSRF